MLQDDSAQVESFTLKELKPGAGNPTSLGVYRVAGGATLNGKPQRFSLVVKHLADGRPYLDASKPEYWNYWRREMDLFESPIASRIPDSIDYPKYLGQSSLPDGSGLFWNGDLGDLEKNEWTWQDCITATSLVAELNSMKSDDLEQYEWLNRSQVDGWAELLIAWNVVEPNLPILVELAQLREETASAFEYFGKYLNRYDDIGRILKGGRQSFVHGDYNLNNLVPAKGNRRLIALDWQLCGQARLGTEVAAIFNTAVEHKVIAADETKFDELCSVYTTRFNSLNPDTPIALDEIRLAAAAMGYFILVNMGLFFMNFPAPETEAERRERLQGMVNDFTLGPVTLYAKVLSSLS
jgi:hypothetical protein